jgi:hypothetical protein
LSGGWGEQEAETLSAPTRKREKKIHVERVCEREREGGRAQNVAEL